MKNRRWEEIPVWLGLFAGICFIAGLRHAATIPLMGDELVSNYIGKLSPNEVLGALKTGADSQGPLFHLANWAWLSLGGMWAIPPEIWQRLPSIIAWSLALWLTQKSLKTVVSPVFAAAATLTILAWPESQLHLAENRAYGHLMLALGATLFLNMCSITNKGASLPLVGIAAVQAAGALCHPMAGVFGAASLVAAEYAWKKKTGCWSWKICIAYAGGWLMTVPWAVGLSGQVNGTLNPALRWAGPPNIQLLWEFLKPGWWLAAFAAAAWATAKLKKQTKENTPEEHLITATGILFILVGVALWVVSQKTNPLFLARYVLPIRLGWACLLAGYSRKLGTPTGAQNIVGALGLGAMAILTMWGTPQPREVTGGFWSANPWVDAGLADKKFLEPSLPIACESSTVYLPRHFYSTWGEYYLILNPKTAKEDGGAAALDFNMNRALAALDKTQRIISASDFAEKFQRFYLWDESQISTGNHAFPPEKFKWKDIPTGTKPGNLRLFLIERSSEENTQPKNSGWTSGA